MITLKSVSYSVSQSFLTVEQLAKHRLPLMALESAPAAHAKRQPPLKPPCTVDYHLEVVVVVVATQHPGHRASALFTSPSGKAQ